MKKQLSVALLALALSACGANTDSAAKGDPGYVFEQVRTLRTGEGLDMIEPHHLKEALPNHSVSVRTDKGTINDSFSDMVLVGTITGVRPGDAIAYDNPDPIAAGDEEAYHQVDFDDPDAVDRNIVVTVKVETSAGEQPMSDEVQFRMGVLAGADPAKFMAGLRAIGKTAILLDHRKDGRHAGELVPVMGGALIGAVSADGSIAFPGLGSSERTFVDGLDTVTQLEDAANAPSQVHELN